MLATPHASACRAALLVLLMAAQLLTAGGVRGADAAPVTDPLGEWYAVGHRMAQESLPSFRMLELVDASLSRRLSGVVEGLGVRMSTLKSTQLKLLQQGWDDGLAGKSAAMTFPPDQSRSLVPKALQGFHHFQGKAGAAEESLADKVAEWKKAVVKVRATTADGQGDGHGSGFFIGPGLVMTNQHVVEGASRLTVVMEADGSEHAGTQPRLLLRRSRGRHRSCD